MIDIYCKKIEKNETLCQECKALKEYAHKKLDKCKYGEHKSTCRKCKTHCYHKEQREKIRYIMRTVGPKMLFYHPIEAVRHLIQEHF